MANAKHLELLRQGIDAWNAWKEKEYSVKPDLSGAEMGRAQLSGARLVAANLSGANLSGANLSRAQLGGANLSGANLIEANLSGASLIIADLTGANLTKADLTDANLIQAKLPETNLSEAVLTAANCIAAVFTKADLREAYLANANLSNAVFTQAHLSRAYMPEANLTEADLTRAELHSAILTKANLTNANLTGANLTNANFIEANITGANFTKSELHRANLTGANLTKANLSGANLSMARLTGGTLVETDLRNADLTGCSIYGIAAWGLKLSEGTKQQNLLITPEGEPDVTVDNIEVAQFVYLLLHNEKIRDAIDTIGKKGVLLLGRFTAGRIRVLERLREELRKRDFLPIVFNFDKPETKDFTETVRLLAGLSRFVIADITNPRSAPLELQAIVPDYMIPFVPIIEEGEQPFAMFKDLWLKHGLWVLKPVSYASVEELVHGLDKGIVEPALARFKELMKKKAEEMPITSMRDIVGDR